MDKKKIGIIAGVLAVILLIVVTTVVYRQGDHSGPTLTLMENYEAGYGEQVGLFDLVRAVSDESEYTVSITSGGEVSVDGRSTVFPRAGEETVEITAIDAHGNHTVKKTTVKVTDTKPPVIHAADRTVDLGDVVDLRTGVTAEDEMDGALTGSIQVDTSQVDEARPGVYPVIYTVSDHSGNVAVVRTALTIRNPEARSISLNRQNLVLDGNGHYQLTAQVEPRAWNGNVVWETSDPDVATVYNGLVTWTGRGSCTITATADGVSTECEVECSYVTVSSIRINKGNLELNYGENVELKARIIPTNWWGDVIWTSSDTTVASVENGTVHWQGQGECVITATADGRNSSCTVKCLEPQVDSVEIIEEEIVLDARQSYQITPVVSPQGWPGELVWTSSDPTVATVTDGLVRWTGAGTCVITASAGTATDSVTVTCEAAFLDGLLEGLFGDTAQSGNGEANNVG